MSRRWWLLLLVAAITLLAFLGLSVSNQPTVTIKFDAPDSVDGAPIDWGLAAVFYLVVLGGLALAVMFLVRGIKWLARRIGGKPDRKADIF
jgi:hypothetical protein